MNEPIEFSSQEQYLLSYYRNPHLSSGSRHLVRDILVLVSSLACMAWYIFHQDSGTGFVGYGILFWRVAYQTWGGQRYGSAFSSIIKKYDQKVQELTARLEK
jgi:hypothetical protein